MPATGSGLRSALAEHWSLTRRLAAGGVGPLLSFVALFGLPVLGAVVLDDVDFAFWSLLSTIATVALSLDFGGTVAVTARFFSEPRAMLLIKSCALSAGGALMVGLLACLLWIPFSTTAMGRAIPDQTALPAIAAMSVASALRSVLAVIAQAALVTNRLALRNTAIAGHSFLAAMVSVVLLFYTRSYWALPLGWLISGVALSAAVVPWAWQVCVSTASDTAVSQPFIWRRFAGLRTASAITSSVLLTSDRWIVGALGGPALLAAYEVAWRFGVLPRFLVQNLILRVGADAAKLGRADRDEFTGLIRQTSLIAVVIGAVTCAPVAVAYGVFAHLSATTAHWPLFVAILAAFTVVGFASPLSFTAAAIGNGWIDLPYLSAALATSGVAAAAAWHLDNPWIFIAGYLLATVLPLVWYVRYVPGVIAGDLHTRDASTQPGSTRGTPREAQ